MAEKVEEQKSVADMILDKFEEDIKNEPLFDPIADKVVVEIRQTRPSKKVIGEILAEDED